MQTGERIVLTLSGPIWRVRARAIVRARFPAPMARHVSLQSSEWLSAIRRRQI
jgi:hypothetical protein